MLDLEPFASRKTKRDVSLGKIQAMAADPSGELSGQLAVEVNELAVTVERLGGGDSAKAGCNRMADDQAGLQCDHAMVGIGGRGIRCRFVCCTFHDLRLAMFISLFVANKNQYQT
ncbi:hypothetical protein P4133_11480 [Pseudomonas aeruginosa]|nr:hypothetical protein [Pseudomonas aeruginosa]